MRLPSARSSASVASRAGRLVAPVLALLAAACDASPPRTPAPRPLPAPDERAPLLAPGGPRSPRIASYRIDARLDAGAKRIVATETLTWRHTGAAPVTSLPFHLYMNAFKHEDSVFLRESGDRFSAPASGWGWIDVTSIRLRGHDGELRPAARHGVDETTLEVPLPRPVAPGETVEVTLAFTTQLPPVFARTGHAGEFLMVGQWFPKIGVLGVVDGTQRWHCEPFHANSEFFADFGVYDVILTVPATHVVAATGVLTETSVDAEGAHVLTYRAEDVHDFAWVADPWMRVRRGRVVVAGREVEVRVLHRPEQAAYAGRHLAAAERTIAALSAWLVPYPWPIFTVVDVPPGAEEAGGMEYPTLVTTTGDFPIAGVRVAEYVTIHEVAHNWFQGILASNEVDEAWLDEGLTEYVGALVLDDWLGAERSLVDLPGIALGAFDIERLAADPASIPLPAATPSYRLHPSQYGAASYTKPAQALRTLEGMVGRERLLAALGRYARRHAFGHPARSDLFAALRDELGDEAEGFVRAAILGTGAIDVRVAGLKVARDRLAAGVVGPGLDGKTIEPPAVEPPRWRSSALLENLGEVPARVAVELRFADGHVERDTWDSREGWRRVERVREAPLDEVRLDPDGALALERRALDDGLRRTPRSGASWRAAARAGFWQQTLLQLVGL